MKTPFFKHITRTLATASQLIIAAPVRLPPQVVAIAKYVSLGIALLDAVIPKEEEEAGGQDLKSGGKEEVPNDRN